MKVKETITDEVNAYSQIDELKMFSIKEIEKRDNAQNRDYLKRIEEFRKFE